MESRRKIFTEKLCHNIVLKFLMFVVIVFNLHDNLTFLLFVVHPKAKHVKYFDKIPEKIPHTFYAQ